MSRNIVQEKIEKIKTMGACELDHFKSVVSVSLLADADKATLTDAILEREKIVYQSSGAQVEFSEVELD